MTSQCSCYSEPARGPSSCSQTLLARTAADSPTPPGRLRIASFSDSGPVRGPVPSWSARRWGRRMGPLPVSPPYLSWLASQKRGPSLMFHFVTEAAAKPLCEPACPLEGSEALPGDGA